MVGKGRVFPFEAVEWKRGRYMVSVTQAEDGQRRGQRQRQWQVLQWSLGRQLGWWLRRIIVLCGAG